MKKVLIIGASSSIAHQAAICFARNGSELVLAGRNLDKLNSVKNDIFTRYETKIELVEFDTNDFDSHESLLTKSTELLDGLTAVLIAHGTLSNQIEIQDNVQEIIKEFNTNCMSAISLSTIFGKYFEKKKSGSIAVITSVAGDRGRKSNYIYGTAKGALSIFLQGLRNRLSTSNVNVLTIKPGFVDTPMTSHLPKGFLFAKASDVGQGIFDAMLANKDIVYLPGFWRLIMFIVKHIPESIFKKMNF